MKDDTMTTDFFISIILPVYNKQNSIPVVIKSIKEVMNELNTNHFEILLIDDNSTDRSVSTIMNLKTENITLLRHSHNQGQLKAIETGLRAAKGNIIAIYSCDMQNSFRTIPQLLDAIKNGYELAVGYRATRSEAGLSVCFSKLFFKILSILDTRMPVGGFDFGLFNLRVYNELMQRNFNRIFIQLELLDISKKTFYLPIERYSDKLDCSSWSLNDKVRYSIKTFKYIFR